jgi:hypothetical protein
MQRAGEAAGINHGTARNARRLAMRTALLVKRMPRIFTSFSASRSHSFPMCQQPPGICTAMAVAGSGAD